MYYLTKWRYPLSVILITLLAMLFSGLVVPTLVRAQPLELQYSNNISAPDGLTLDISGPLYVLFHGKFGYHESSVVKSCHSYSEPMPVVSLAIMVRAPLDVINAATGASYRLHGHFKVSMNKQGISGGQFCDNVMAWSWADTVDIITPEGVRAFTLKFYTELDMATASLLYIEVESAQLN
jgi:hypothetical protein